MEEYKGKDVLGEWLNAEMRLNIDGKVLVLKPTMDHYRLLKSLVEFKDDPEKAAEKQKEVLTSILSTTYPDSKFIEDFLDRYGLKLQLELYAEITGIPVDDLKKKFFQEITKNLEEKE